MRNFDSNRVKNEIIEFIKNYYKKYELDGAVLGISGGKDSGVVAALLVSALGRENVVGLTLPCYSKEEDRVLAQEVSKYYGFKLYNIDLTKVFDSFKEEVNKIDDFKGLEAEPADMNIKSRLRMVSCYYMASFLSAVNNKKYLVVGTSNKSELFVGYFTKGGDFVCDIAPIADLMVDEVIKIGEVLNVPKEILYKTPSDGLSNLTDEEKLGVSYDSIASYINNTGFVSKKDRMKIESLHEASKHKFVLPIYKVSDNIDNFFD